MDLNPPQSAAQETCFHSLTVASTPTTFPLTKLPIELQLQVLEACLIRPQPLIDFFRSRNRSHDMIRTWSWMDERCESVEIEIVGGTGEKPYVNILYTSRFFRKEGMKILFTKNRFILTGLVARPIKVPTGRPERLYFAQLRHLNFLHYTAYPALSMFGTLWQACKAAQRLPELETFEVDFVDTPRGIFKDRQIDAYEPEAMNVRRFARAFSRRPNPHSKLKEICMTGLILNDLTLLMVRVMKSLLSPAGLMGVGFDKEGSRYEPRSTVFVNSRLILRPNTGMTLHWMAQDGVEAWVRSTLLAVPWDNDYLRILFDSDDFASCSESEAGSGSESED